MMAAHYKIGVLPARPKSPRDKAKAESGVLFAQRYILGRLRNRQLLLAGRSNTGRSRGHSAMNEAVMRRLGISRRQLFEAVEGRRCGRCRRALRICRVAVRPCRSRLSHRDRGFFYSVPFGLIGQQLDVRLTERTIEVFHRGKRVAAHERRYNGRATAPSPSICRATAITLSGPPSGSGPGGLDRAEHRGLIIAIWSPGAIPSRAFGPASACCGVPRLAPDRVETLAIRAMETGMLSYPRASSAHHRQDHTRRRKPPRASRPPPNVRGPGYFH